MFGSPRLGMCYDSGHGNADKSGGTGIGMLTRFGHKLMALHLHDNNGINDQHLLPFDGTVDWSAIMRRINDTVYTGPTTLEMGGNYPDMTAEEFIYTAFERAKKLDAMRKG